MPSDPKNAAAGELREAFKRVFNAGVSQGANSPVSDRVLRIGRRGDELIDKELAALATPPDPAASQGDAARAATDWLRPKLEDVVYKWASEYQNDLDSDCQLEPLIERLLAALSTGPSASGEAGLRGLLRDARQYVVDARSDEDDFDPKDRHTKVLARIDAALSTPPSPATEPETLAAGVEGES